MQKTQDWSGLLALWRGIKRAGAVLAMAIVMGIGLGFTSGILTIWCYGLGMYLGFPIGFVWGGLLGSRMAPRDAALVFVATLVGAEIGLLAAGRQTQEGLTLFAAWGAAYALSILVAFGVGGTVPVKARYPLALATTWGFGLYVSFKLVQALWFSG